MRWNTTALTNGPHTAKVIIFDTAGQTCSKEVSVTVANTRVDAGPDGARSDGRSTGTPDSGCGCRAGGRASPRDGLAALVALLVLGLTISRRAKDAAGRASRPARRRRCSP
jgi:MYXO-CTERM domain-containing protein